MNFEELNTKLKEAYESDVEAFAYDEKNQELGFEEIDQIGGVDQGSNWYSVKYFKKYDIYIKVSGWYQSHYGTDFESWDYAVEEVKPAQKTITVFE